MKTINTINTSIKGLWLEADILSIEELDITNSVLLQEIINLSKLKDGCFASNNHFAELLKINKSYASKRISQLVKLGFITTKNIFKNKNCIGRIITPNFEKIKSASKIELPVEIVEENNIPTAAAQVVSIVEENNIPTSAAQVEEQYEELPVEFELEIQEQHEEPDVLENNNPTENPAETILSNFEKFKLEEEEKENIQRIHDQEKQQEIIQREEQEKEQELQNEIMKQKTIQSRLADDIAKQQEKLNSLKQQTGKTNKELLDEHFALTLPEWLEEYEDLSNSMFCRQYKNLITEDVKLIINQFERDLMFGRYAFNSGQLN